MDLLRHLKFFTTVAEVRHFGHAADDLNMTQPPLSQGIQRLERRLGLRLFERNARSVVITPAGAQLLPSAQRVVTAAEDFCRAADATARNAVPLRIGVPIGLGVLLLRSVAAVGAASAVPVVPVLSGSAELANQVATGELDVAVVRHPLVVDGTRAGPVQTLQTFLVSGAPLGRHLPDLPFAVPPRQHHPPAHDQFVDSLRRAGHSGTTLDLAAAETVSAVVACGAALTVTVDAGQPSPLTVAALPPELAPMRVRVVTHPLRSRADVDLAAVAAELEAAVSATD